MSFWQRLDISPTTDIKAIKRAYAAQLKLHHPEDDPAGYQELREAFDAALAYAKRKESAPKSESEFSGEPANGGFAGIPAEEPPEKGVPKLPRVVYEPDIHTEEEPGKSPLVPPVRIPPLIPADDPSERETTGWNRRTFFPPDSDQDPEEPGGSVPAYIRSLPESDPLKNRLIHAGPYMETLTFSGIAAFDYALYLTLFVSASKVGFQIRGEADVFRDKLFKIAYAKYRSWHEYFQACIAGIYFVLAQPERINELGGRHYAFLRQQADEQNSLRSLHWNELNA